LPAVAVIATLASLPPVVPGVCRSRFSAFDAAPAAAACSAVDARSAFYFRPGVCHFIIFQFCFVRLLRRFGHIRSPLNPLNYRVPEAMVLLIVLSVIGGGKGHIFWRLAAAAM
jgi:hypothetical protein